MCFNEGMNWATRKIAKRLTPKIIISFVKSPGDDEKLLRIEYQTVVKNMEQIYKCPGTTKHRGIQSSSQGSTERQDRIGTLGPWIPASNNTLYNL